MKISDRYVAQYVGSGLVVVVDTSTMQEAKVQLSDQYAVGKHLADLQAAQMTASPIVYEDIDGGEMHLPAEVVAPLAFAFGYFWRCAAGEAFGHE